MLGWSFFRFRESHEVIRLQLVFAYFDLLEAGDFDFVDEDLLAGADMAEDEFRAFAFDAVKVDQHQLPIRFERLADRGQRILRLFEAVVGIADEYQID